MAPKKLVKTSNENLVHTVKPSGTRRCSPAIRKCTKLQIGGWWVAAAAVMSQEARVAAPIDRAAPCQV